MGIVILYGPSASGKSRRSEEYRVLYGCKRVIDEWDGVSPLSDHDLAITNIPPPYNVSGARVVDVVKAKMKLMDNRVNQ